MFQRGYKNEVTYLLQTSSQINLTEYIVVSNKICALWNKSLAQKLQVGIQASDTVARLRQY
uniref:Uncharacterized protein n=1 Tax=viral metagenome TaxID=1070528 RepID=A0A6M3LBW2_9ZZZZ